MTISFLRRAGWGSLLALTALLGPIGASSAASYTVLNTNSTGSDSLQAAIAAAQADSDPSDTITFAPGVTGTISLSGTELNISKDLTITGPGANLLTISGGGQSRVFGVYGATVSLSGLTIANGDNSFGGGLYSNGTLTVSACAFLNNSATSFAGGGIYSNGTLTVTNCTFSGNSADYGGGGIYSHGTLTITGSTFSGNSTDYGGGIFNNNNTLTITGSTFSGNSGQYGGGLYTNATATLTACLFTGSAGADIYGSVTSGGSNLLGDGNGNGITGGTNHDQTSVSAADAKLGPLQDNGGPTKTCALLPGSPAIDADYATTSTTDQRGFVRPTGIRNDIGAYEYGAAAPVTLTSLAVTPTTPSVLVGGTQPLTATATYSDNHTADVTTTASWASSDTSKATIDASGLATGVAAGTANVTATYNGVASAPVTFTVTDTPTAAGDNYLVQANTPLTIAAPGLLANDTSPSGAPLAAVLVTAPGQGTVTLNADGSFVYTPTAGFLGVDTFTYQASDGTNSSSPVTVTLFVIAAPAPPPSYQALWNKNDGSFSVWNVATGGTFDPYDFDATPGYAAQAVADTPDGHVHVLLTAPTGAVQFDDADLSTLTRFHNAAATASYGPFPGWTAHSLAAGPDGVLRVLWTRTDGMLSLWKLHADGTYDHAEYGPFPGWSAQLMSVAADNTVRVFWTKTNGKMSFWVMDGAGDYTHTEYGPYPGWTPSALTTSAHGLSFVTWNHSGDGQVSVWGLQDSGQFQFVDFGPYSDWTAGSVVMGADGILHLGWSRPGGAASLWDVTSGASLSFTSTLYGPYSDWHLQGLAAAP